MIEFTLHPHIYRTGNSIGLRHLLEKTWVRHHQPGDGTFYIISGFANFNGGARFYRTFRQHTEQGGRVVAYLGGSTSQRLSSKQAVTALLECGAEVHIINRKRLLHAKCYGAATSQGEQLIVTSGNFTGPGMVQNVESSVWLSDPLLQQSKFSWQELISQLNSQNWARYQLTMSDKANPGWQLLYDETPGQVLLDESETVTLILILGHADTVRIQASADSKASLGSQYFWLSKDSYDFFPPLTIRNQRGIKGTLSALITLHYVDLGLTDTACRVTFEAENNLDFRLGTGKLRYSQLCRVGDLACISRVQEDKYDLRLIRQDSSYYGRLLPYAVHFIGHQGKRYGYIDNAQFASLLDTNPLDS